MKRLLILSVLATATVVTSGCCGTCGGHRLFGGGLFGNSSCDACCDSCGESGCSSCGAGSDVISSTVGEELILPPAS